MKADTKNWFSWLMIVVFMAISMNACSAPAPAATPTKIKVTATRRKVTATPRKPSATKPAPTLTATSVSAELPGSIITSTELVDIQAAATELAGIQVAPTEAAATEMPPASSPTLLPLPSKTPTLGGNMMVIYFVQKETTTASTKKTDKDKKDKDKESKRTGGCLDQVVYINSGMPRTGVIETDAATALTRLFSYKSEYVGSLYNPVYRSTFSVVRVSYKAGLSQLTVELDGSYVRTGDKCDNRRVRDQIWSTARQFPGVKSVIVYVNGNLLGDILANDK